MITYNDGKLVLRIGKLIVIIKRDQRQQINPQIDMRATQREVQEITNTNEFKSLQERALQMRQARLNRNKQVI